jgi:hypothetical protein
VGFPWLEERRRASAKQSEDETSMQIGGYEDSRWQQLLTQHGYVRDGRIEGEPHFARTLDNIEQQTPLTGIEFRSIAGEHEATERTMMQRAACALHWVLRCQDYLTRRNALQWPCQIMPQST